MMVVRNCLGVLKDRDGFPILSLTGSFEFCYKSVKDSVVQADLSDDIRELVNNGRFEILETFVSITDDNDVNLNVTLSSKVVRVFNVSDILANDFDLKALRNVFGKELKLLHYSFEDLEKEALKKYERGKQDHFEKAHAQSVER